MITKDEFRADAAAFLEANAERRVEVTQVWGRGSDEVSIFPERTPEEDGAMLSAAKEWRAKVFDAGFGWISGPEAYGGRGLTREYERVWLSLENDYDVPSIGPFGIGLGMVAPTILAHAVEGVKQRYLTSMYRGDTVACQLFSEPVAGSDLAGIQTKAIRDGEEWILNGQKVWTSGAQYSDIGEIITRTSSYPDSRHRGLTMFLVDMKAPGVEVRPLRQLNGHSEFGEVFFTDVVVPDGDRLGPEGLGWSVAISTLMQERSGLSGRPGVGPGQADALAVRARRTGAWDDPVLRDRIMQAFITERVLQMATVRAFASLGRSEPGAEGSIRKLTHAQLEVTLGLLATEAEPGDAIAWDAPDQDAAAAVDAFLSGKILSIAGGTSEIQRNIIGERVLGLPRDRDPYADTPFEERPNG